MESLRISAIGKIVISLIDFCSIPSTNKNIDGKQSVGKNYLVTIKNELL